MAHGYLHRPYCSMLGNCLVLALAQSDIMGVMQELLGKSLWPVLYRRSEEMIIVAPSGLKIYEILGTTA